MKTELRRIIRSLKNQYRVGLSVMLVVALIVTSSFQNVSADAGKGTGTDAISLLAMDEFLDIFPEINPLGVSESVYAADANQSTPVLDALPAISNVSKPLIKGTTSAAASVAIYRELNGSYIPLADTVADEEGRFSVKLNLTEEGLYRLTATSRVGGDPEGPFAESIETILDLTPPDRASEGKWFSPHEGSVRLAWSPPANEVPEKYRIYRDRSLFAETPFPYYDDNTVEESTAYEYEIIPVDAAGNWTGWGNLEMIAGTANVGLKRLDRNQGWEVKDAVISSDGKFAAWIEHANSNAGEEAYALLVRELPSGKPETIVETTEGQISAPFLSGDGRLLLYRGQAASGTGLYLYDRNKSTTAFVTGSDAVNSGELTDDGTQVLYIQFSDPNSPVIHSYNVAERRLETKPAPESWGSGIDKFDFSGNGRYLAYSYAPSENDPAHIYLFDLETGATELAVEDANKPALSADGAYLLYQGERNSLYRYDRNGKSSELLEDAGGEKTYNNIRVTGDGKGAVYEFQEYDSLLDPWRMTIMNTDSKEAMYLGNAASSQSNGMIDASGDKVVFLDDDTTTRNEDGRFRLGAFLYCKVMCEDGPPPGEGIRSVSWKASSLIGMQAELGGNVTIHAEGDAGSAMTATVTYSEVSSGSSGETTGTKDVSLTEKTTGAYSGTLDLSEGISAITGIVVKAVRDGKTFEKSADYLPLAVSGRLSVTMDAPDSTDLSGSTLIAWSAARKNGNSIPAASPGSVALPVFAADDYQITLIGSNGQRWGEEKGPVRVRSGLTTDAEIGVRIPSIIRAIVQNDQGKGIPNAIIRIRDQESGKLLAVGRTNETGESSMPAGHTGQHATVGVEMPGNYDYPPDRSITLGQDTLVEYKVSIAKGRIRGTVTDEQGKATPGVIVTATQPGFKESAVTGEDGTYTLHAPIGPSTIEAVKEKPPFWITERPVHIEVPREGITQDLNVSSKGKALVDLAMLSKQVDSDWESVELDISKRNYYQISVQLDPGKPGASMLNPEISGNRLVFPARSGQTAKICVSTLSPEFKPGCSETVLDEYRKASVEIRLTEYSAIKGSIVMPSPYSNRYSALLLPLDQEGKPKGNGISYTVKSPFKWNVPDPGRYRLILTYWYGDGRTSTMEKEMELLSGQYLNLGELKFSPPGLFGGVPGNSLYSLTSEAVPGGNVTFHGRFANNSGTTAEEAELVLRIPSGARLLEQSVTLDGEPVASEKRSDTEYLVKLGDVSKGRKGVISYRLKLSDDVSETIRTELNMEYGQQASRSIESIGSVVTTVARLSLDIPETSSEYVITATGRAPGGSRILLYDGDRLAGEALATPGGLWARTIELNPIRFKPHHRIKAAIVREGAELATATRIVEVDPDLPFPVELIIDHNRRTVVDLTKGTARLPLSVNPHNGFLFTLKFHHGKRAENPVLHVGSNDVALQSVDENTYRGFLLPPIQSLGDISLDFNSKPSPYVEPVDIKSEELMESLPEEFQGMNTKVEPYDGGEPGHVYSPKVTITSAIMPSFRIEAHYDAVPLPDYKPGPLPEDGPPIYELRRTERTEGSKKVVNIEMIIPVNQLAPAMANQLKSLKLSDAAKVNLEFTADLGASLYDIVDVITSGEDYENYMENLERVLADVENISCLPPSRMKHHVETMDRLADNYLSNLVWNYTGTLAGIALTASGFGIIMGLTVSAITFGVSYMQQKEQQENYDKLMREIEADKAKYGESEECKEDKDPKKPKRDKPPLALPVYIYDPSGYVYEAVPSNRVPDVLATLYGQDPVTKEWIPWNAGWFGQLNPQRTDSDGKYGWDVPEGQWKVVYEKTGYELAESEELEVLPPHFDVNVPMVSYIPPSVEAVYFVEEGKQLQVDFSKYMRLDTLTADKFSVVRTTGGVESRLNLTVVPFHEDSSHEGEEVAASIRLVPDPATPFVFGESLQLRLSKELFSYAGVPLDQAYEKSMSVTTELPIPEEAVRQPELTAGVRELLLTWETVESFSDPSVRIYWKARGGSAYQVSELMPVGLSMYPITGLEPGTAYDVRVVTVNPLGTESPGISVEGLTRIPPKPEPTDQTPPQEVTSAQATVEGSRLRLGWNNPTDEDFEQVRIYVQRNAEAWSDPIIVPKVLKSHVLENLAVGSYRVKIATTDRSGNESSGILLTATIQGGGQPPPMGGASGGNIDPNSVEVKIGPDGGEFASFADQVRIYAMKGTFGAETKLKLVHKPANDSKLPEGYTWMSDSFVIDAGNVAIGKPLLLSLLIDKESAKGTDERRLGIYKRDSASPTGWQYVGGIVDQNNHRVDIRITDSGEYGVLLYNRDFVDLSGHWSRADVDVLVSRHIIDGVGDNRFEPNRGITRAEIVKLLFESLQQQGVSTDFDRKGTTFDDVAEGAWYAPYVDKAVRLKLMEGFANRFRPNDVVTREELAVLLCRFAKLLGMQLPASGVVQPLDRFDDAAAVSSWAKAAVGIAVQEGWIHGMTASLLKPQAEANRAMSAALVLRVLTSIGIIAK